MRDTPVEYDDRAPARRCVSCLAPLRPEDGDRCRSCAGVTATMVRPGDKPRMILPAESERAQAARSDIEYRKAALGAEAAPRPGPRQARPQARGREISRRTATAPSRGRR